MAAPPNYHQIAANIAARTAAQYGIDPGYFSSLFQAQIGQESGFNPNAHSGAGAEGIAQIVPKYHPGVDPYKPQQALAYAARMDAQNYKKYGNFRDMLSVYNSGRPWSVGMGIGETNNYVKSILAHAGGKNAAWGDPSQGAPMPGKPPARPGLAGNNNGLIGFLINNALTATGQKPLPFDFGSIGGQPAQTLGNGVQGPVRPLQGFSGPTKLVPVPSQYETHSGMELNAPALGEAERLANQFGVKINSGYRSPSHNAAVGGAQNSDHLSGNAVDFTGSPAAMKALYAYALKHGYAYVEPWNQAGGNHVHISFSRPGKGLKA